MTERRASPRKSVLLPGTIESKGGGSTPCLVRDVSISGASLEVANPTDVPDFVTLVVAAAEMRVRCRVVWRGETQLGLAFE